jgi:hypothetical protein
VSYRKPSQDALEVEREMQRAMLARLGIEWTPGEPFVALVEDEIESLRVTVQMLEGQLRDPGEATL